MTNASLGLLYRLQKIEAELRDLSQKSERSAEADALREAEERRARLSRLLESAEAAARKARRRVQELEAELARIDEALVKNERRLYGGEVAHPRELAALEERVGRDRRRKAELEDEILSAMEALEQRAAEVDAVRKAAAESRQAAAEAEEAFERAKARWAEERRLKSSERDRLRSSVPGELLALYDSLAPRLSGRPVAAVEEGRCGGCHLELPTALRRGASNPVPRCPNCSRLLWWP